MVLFILNRILSKTIEESNYQRNKNKKQNNNHQSKKAKFTHWLFTNYLKIMTSDNATCPSLNNLTSNPVILTIDNLKLLRLSSYNRSVGTVIQVSCYKTLKLYGSPSVTCQKNFTWSSEPNCEYAVVEQPMSERTKLIISLSTISGFLVLLTLISIICFLFRKDKRETDNYKNIQNGSLYYSTESLKFDSLKQKENIHLNPVTLPQNQSQWGEMETALPRLPSNTSLDTPTNLRKKKYDFEEFNVYALRQGRDPFLWRPVVSNMHFDN